jgi:hypothetical protein
LGGGGRIICFDMLIQYYFLPVLIYVFVVVVGGVAVRVLHDAFV